MIVPLQVVIDQIDEGENFSVDPHPFAVGARTPKYRVKMTALDLEKSLVISYEFHSMIDRSQPSYSSVGVITHTDIANHANDLRRIRDQIDAAIERAQPGEQEDG